jgi:CDP-diacylglycerol--glycerol-3-phosphate 3-phosphatidyltransferase
MTLADKVTSLRLILAPVFFGVYLSERFFPALFDAAASPWERGGAGWTVPVLWALFIICEITDLLDGKIARARNEVGDFGKLFDPFADTLMRITYFLCFVVDGLLPSFLFLIVLYREFGILFLRILMMKKGVAQGARQGGKIKAVLYMCAGAFALLASSALRLGFSAVFGPLKAAALALFALSVAASLFSFFDYVRVWRATGEA